MRIAAIMALTFGASQAFADIHVQFDESAPKDRFTITRTGACDMGAADVTLDLAGSAHGLIFDVTATGGGVEVFQPFEMVSGTDNLSSLPSVRDGDQAITLPISQLGQAQSIAFTIDVDDTAGAREITVSDAEISGAQVTVVTSSGTFVGTFDNGAKAVVQLDDCAS